MCSINLFDTGKELSYEKIRLLTKGQKHIAECIVFTEEYQDKRKIDFSYINLCSDISVEECVDSIIEYASYNKFRLIEYPLLKLYSDGTFCSDNETFCSVIENDEFEIQDDYQEVVEQNINNKQRRNASPSVAFNISQYVLQQYEYTNRLQVTHVSSVNTYTTYQILPNTFPYKTHISSMSISISKYESILNEDSNENVDISGKACIYQQKKAIDVWVSKGNNYKKTVDTVNVDFLKSLVLVLDTFDNGDDIYTKLHIDNVPIKCLYKPNNHQYRINKWGRYSDIESYNIAFGYQNINSIKIKVINSLCFPGGFIDLNYVDYTAQVYDDLLGFATGEVFTFKRKRPRQYVITKKMIVKKSTEDDTNIIEEYNTNTIEESNEDTLKVADNRVLTSFPNTSSDCLGYIYLLREREFYKRNENVYKVGRTIQKGTSLMLDRLKAYKKGSELVMIRQVHCDNVEQIETSIVKEFQKNFTKHSDGREYFIGDVNNMMDIINDTCRKQVFQAA